MNAFSPFTSLPIAPVGSEEWKREMLLLQARTLLRREARATQIGQLALFSALVGIWLLATRVAAGFGIDLAVTDARLDGVLNAGIMLGAIMITALGIVLWRQRWSLGRSELRLIEYHLVCLADTPRHPE